MTMVFTRDGLTRGAWAILPLAFGGALFGTALGMMARQAGLSAAEIVLMSLTVFAGASQFLALELWAQPLPVLAIVLSTAAVNARHLLMGAALAPWLMPLKRSRAYGSLYFMTDENWGLSMARFQDGENDIGFFVGGGLLLYCVWSASSLFGHFAAGLIADPSRYGIDALATGVFVALLVLQWRGRRSLVPWLVAIATALCVHALLPGGWHVIIGALAGSLAGVFTDER